MINSDRIKYASRFNYFHEKGVNCRNILEVGPGHAPVYLSSENKSVEYIDVMDKENLCAKYNSMGMDISSIPYINYVWRGEALNKLVNKNSHFDMIFASHVIEHIPNPINFLNECETLLTDDGSLFLVVPDRRRCFDYFRPYTSTGGLLDAYREQRTKHSPGSVFDFNSFFTSLNGKQTWFSNESICGDFKLYNELKSSFSAFSLASSSDEYIDAHGWVFTPMSFILIMYDLCRLGLINLKVEALDHGDAHEFYVILKHDDSHGAWCNSFERIDILKNIAREYGADTGLLVF